MMVADYSWLFILAEVLGVLFGIAALSFLFTRWSRFPRATSWAFTGVGTILLSQIASHLLRVLAAQFLKTNQFIFANAMVSLLATLMFMAGISLLIVAVYVDRPPQSADAKTAESADSPEVGTRWLRDPNNPYAV